MPSLDDTEVTRFLSPFCPDSVQTATRLVCKTLRRHTYCSYTTYSDIPAKITGVSRTNYAGLRISQRTNKVFNASVLAGEVDIVDIKE